MPTHRIPDLLGFTPVEGRKVVACFDGGALSLQRSCWAREPFNPTASRNLVPKRPAGRPFNCEGIIPYLSAWSASLRAGVGCCKSCS